MTSGEHFGFDSSDSEIIIIDGPGDKSPGPLPPHVLKLAMAEREKIDRWEKYRAENPGCCEVVESDVFIIDGPSEKDLKPLPPHLLKIAMEERAKIDRWEKWKADRPQQETSLLQPGDEKGAPRRND